MHSFYDVFSAASELKNYKCLSNHRLDYHIVKKMENSEQQTNSGQSHGNNHVSLETIFEILGKLGLNLVTKKFQDENVDTKVVRFVSDGDLIRLGIRAIGNRIRLRERMQKSLRSKLFITAIRHQSRDI